MNVDRYLKLSRNYFICEDEHIDILYHIANNMFDLDLDIKVIYSYSARHEVINDNGRKVLIWDMNYWKLFEQYYLLAIALDEVVENQSDLTRCLDLISSIFLYFLANKFENNADVSLSFAKESLKAGYNHIPLTDESHPNFKTINSALFISKVYIFHHELTHLLHDRKCALRQKDLNEVKNSLKFIRDNMISDDFLKYYSEFSKSDVCSIIDEALNGKHDKIIDEMCADMRAMVESLELIDIMNSKKMPHDELVPFGRSCISTVRIFDTFLNSLIKETEYFAPIIHFYTPQAEDFAKQAIFKRKASNNKMLLRVGMSYLLEDLQMVLKYKLYGHFHDKPPLVDNYEKYIVPRFEEFIKKYIPYIIGNACISRDIDISDKQKILMKDFLLGAV